MGRRVHLRLCAAAVVLSLPVAATSTSALRGTAPTLLARAAEPIAPSGSAFGTASATPAAALTAADPDRVAQRVRATVRERLTAASPTGTGSLRGVSLKDLDIPATAYIAYQVAASTMTKADPSCGVDWALIAAIGRVESDHGRYGGARLLHSGLSRPLIRGVALDGSGPVRAIRDTDAGRLDGDKRWDRAVGPMQFLPSTWAYAGVDADGDGVRSPDDINDAALAAAVYLCAAPGRLDNPLGLRTAVHRYNASRAYVDLVVRLTQAYRHDTRYEPTTGSTTLALGEYDGLEPGSASGEQGSGHHPQGGNGTPRGKGPGHDQDPGTGHDTGRGGTVTGAHVKDPVQAFPDPAVTEPVPGPSHSPDPEPTDEPTPGPTDEPSATPGPGPSGNPEPTPGPTPDEPVLVELSGTLSLVEDVPTEDGLTEDQWYLVDPLTEDEVLLDVGDETWLAEPALADLDADEVVESNLDELTGLLGVEVVVQVEEDTDPAVLHTVNDAAYLAD